MAAVLRLNVKLQFLNLQKEKKKKHFFNRCKQHTHIFTIPGESHFIENYEAIM